MGKEWSIKFWLQRLNFVNIPREHKILGSIFEILKTKIIF